MPLSAEMNHPLGWQAAPFSLEGVDGRKHSLDQIKGKNGTVVLFICNHCPYVKAVIADIVADSAALQADGVNTVAIMPNDTAAYPDDSFDNMKRFAAAHGFGFPYVIDGAQSVARAYGAVCTPDIFGFDKDLKLKYRGRAIEMLPGLKPKPGGKRELLEAMRQIARTGEGPADQTPSIGCSIKWKAA